MSSLPLLQACRVKPFHFSLSLSPDSFCHTRTHIFTVIQCVTSFVYCSVCIYTICPFKSPSFSSAILYILLLLLHLLDINHIPHKNGFTILLTHILPGIRFFFFLSPVLVNLAQRALVFPTYLLLLAHNSSLQEWYMMKTDISLYYSCSLSSSSCLAFHI